MRLARPLALSLLILSGAAQAASPPPAVTVQGRMDTQAGTPVNGTYDVTFRLFAASTGGSALFTQALTGVQVAAGVFDVALGPFAAGFFEGSPTLWLEAQVGAEVLPRQPLRSVPWALHAGRAESAATADDVACTGCVASGELGVQWALGATKGGAAADLACSGGCVSATELEAGAVGTSHLQAGAVTSAKVGFNYAGSASVGGPASNLACTGCVDGTDLAATIALGGELSVAGKVAACTANASGCGVLVSESSLLDKNDGWLTVQSPAGVRVRSQDGSAWAPLQFGGGASNGGLTVTGGNLAVAEGNVTITGTSGGWLGVGTTSPDAPLHVRKGAAGMAWKLEAAPGRYLYGGSDALGTYIEQVGDSAAQRLLRIQASDGANTYTQLFIDGANQRIYTSTGMRFGIGTSSPGAELDVAGNARIQGSLTVQSFLNEAPTFFVGGDTDKFYAVVFYDNGWGYGPAEFEVTRSSVHTDSTWFGAMLLQVRWHSSSWGHGSSFLEYRNLASQKSFVARVYDYYYNPYLMVWLRGGSTYRLRSFGNRVTLQGIHGTDNGSCSFDPVSYAGYNTAKDCSYLTAVDAGVTGGQRIGMDLKVDGTVTAPAYNTGDIFFHQGEKMVWRMYEDEAGLYVESGVTGKHYRVMLQELAP